MSTLTVKTTTGKSVKVDNMFDAAKVTNLDDVLSIDAQIAALTEKRKAKVEALYELCGGTGKHVIPGVGEVTFSDNNVYDEDTILAALRPGQQQRVTKRVLDRAKVRALYPAVYKAAQQYRGYKASVKGY